MRRLLLVSTRRKFRCRFSNSFSYFDPCILVVPPLTGLIVALFISAASVRNLGGLCCMSVTRRLLKLRGMASAYAPTTTEQFKANVVAKPTEKFQ
jgi:hypothetical protein